MTASVLIQLLFFTLFTLSATANTFRNNRKWPSTQVCSRRTGTPSREHFGPRFTVVSWLVSWCSEPSQPQRITSGLKTNFNLSPSYSFLKSLSNKSLFLKPQLRFYPQIRNANLEQQYHMFWSLFIFSGHSAREPVSSRVTHVILRAYRGTSVSHSLHSKNSGEVLEKNAGEWTGRVEISEEGIPFSKRTMYGYTLIYSRL